MEILDNCTDLWYLMSDFFYKHKCTNGYIDSATPDYYAFKKNKFIIRIWRINDKKYKMTILNIKTGTESIFEYLESLMEVENTILQYF